MRRRAWMKGAEAGRRSRTAIGRRPQEIFLTVRSTVARLLRGGHKICNVCGSTRDCIRCGLPMDYPIEITAACGQTGRVADIHRR
jgi:hypothetical protein